MVSSPKNFVVVVGPSAGFWFGVDMVGTLHFCVPSSVETVSGALASGSSRGAVVVPCFGPKAPSGAVSGCSCWEACREGAEGRRRLESVWPRWVGNRGKCRFPERNCGNCRFSAACAVDSALPDSTSSVGGSGIFRCISDATSRVGSPSGRSADNEVGSGRRFALATIGVLEGLVFGLGGGVMLHRSSWRPQCSPSVESVGGWPLGPRLDGAAVG